MLNRRKEWSSSNIRGSKRAAHEMPRRPQVYEHTTEGFHRVCEDIEEKLK